MSKKKFDDGNLVADPVKPKLQKPPMYKVVFNNDDFTPMDFVIELLMKYFGHDELKASTIMYDVHSLGKAVAGVYTKDIAQTKTSYAIDEAREKQHPLLITIEVE